MRNFLSDLLGDLDEEQVQAFHTAYDVRDRLTNDEVRMSRNSHIVICYDYIRLEGDFGFLDNFSSLDANSYFSKMKAFSGNSFEGIINDFDYTYHFNRTYLNSRVKKELRKEFGDRINFDDLILYHFALYTNDNADRKRDVKSPRVHFLLGRFGMIYILFYDPYHELC